MNLVLPKVETEASAQNYGRFSIGPLESGYGITLGNALRRVLLASLPGAAVTSIRVSGIHHEFSDIPRVREDMTALILNVKQLRVRLFNHESVRLRAEIKGEGTLTAGDLECPPNVEIVNPDLGGYSPVEERGKLPIGEIPIDAIYSPVRRASYTVERARIGQVTDYDRLVLEVSTDGSISPHDALSEAAGILVQHFTLISGVAEEEPEVEEEDEGGIPARLYETPIEELELTVRAYNCLKRAGITQVGEILEKLQKGEEEILAIRNFGQKSLDELMEKLQEDELMEKLQEKGFLEELERISESSTEEDDSSEEDIDLAA
jgi:DNA-directed RNA polymerase subunit alpha